MVGNFPPLAEAELKIYFFSNLPIEDLSYCLRIPMTYVPRYYGDMQRCLESGAQFIGEPDDL
jgi:hypothetical protein